ncbi:hypothetical protein, partial [Pseudoalteromonas sp. Z1A8]|uniref:hypothetical protein n=1 Tax=Pseudoalteromonas sp. Z1A8 TaxID=2686354 RepID=UPI0019826223
VFLAQSSQDRSGTLEIKKPLTLSERHYSFGWVFLWVKEQVLNYSVLIMRRRGFIPRFLNSKNLREVCSDYGLGVCCGWGDVCCSRGFMPRF